MKCNNCENELKSDAKFCGKCGQKIESVTKAELKEEVGGKKLMSFLYQGILVGIYFDCSNKKTFVV